MKRIVLTYGLISGAVIAAMAAVLVPMAMTGRIALASSELLGYSSMVLAFLAVFFGIRTYRENVGGGNITFGRAFKVGILITLVACAVYVVTWEIVYFNFVPDFVDHYAAAMIAELRERGASAAEIAAEQRKMAEFKRLYANPFFNVGMTFLEVFPVGLIVTLVSAAILRKKAGEESSAAATVIA
ncbi:MAG TPA: DUF4199 domain-containing protein [Thermoanaerobaculia bacterium]|nr:DUF4199 domain-containing protein [Thermoanaerobaculia bacterium]